MEAENRPGPAALDTPRLRLRKARRDDLDAIRRNVWSDASLAETMLWTPTLTREDAEARMTRTLAYQAGYPAYFVCLRDTDEPIGFAGVWEKEPGAWEESGICVAAAHQGRGYGRELLAALVELVFAGFGGKVFRYECFRDNLRSAALCRGLGFMYRSSADGVRERDGYRYVCDTYELTREMWKQSYC